MSLTPSRSVQLVSISVFSFDLCPLSSVLRPLTSDLRPLTSDF